VELIASQSHESPKRKRKGKNFLTQNAQLRKQNGKKEKGNRKKEGKRKKRGREGLEKNQKSQLSPLS
jgi:hypothetical protein